MGFCGLFNPLLVPSSSSSFLSSNSLVLKKSHIVMVEYSDGLEDQSSKATITLTGMNRKVPVVEH